MRERLTTAILWAVTLLLHAGLIGGLVAIVVLGAPHVTPSFLITAPTEIGPGGGIGPQLWNTAYLAVLATAITAPLGIAAGIWLARVARPSRWVDAIRFGIDTMAALPSIVFGLFGFLVFVVSLGWGFSRIGAALTLALVNLPLVVRATESAIERVPRSLEEASFALGATRWQTLRRVTLPAAMPGLASALVLAIGRVFAESAPLVFTAGVGAARYSLDPLASGSTLAVHLWYIQSESLLPDAGAIAAGIALVLVVFAAIIESLANRLLRGPQGAA